MLDVLYVGSVFSNALDVSGSRRVRTVSLYLINTEYARLVSAIGEYPGYLWLYSNINLLIFTCYVCMPPLPQPVPMIRPQNNGVLWLILQ